MEIRKICVVGAGTMGHGIALACAQNGFLVTLTDRSAPLLRSGMEKIASFLSGSVQRGKATEAEILATLGRIKACSDLKECAGDADLAIESVIEDLQEKKSLFEQLDRICPPHAILATNTSAMSITELAAVTARPEKVIGMHWGNPAAIMKGIEVISTEKTSKDVFDTIMGLSRALGKIPTACKDTPGFVINRLSVPWYNESMRVYDEGLASIDDIDTAFKVAYGMPLGPLEFADFMGLDTATGIAKAMSELGNDMFSPALCHLMKVKAGDLGRKTGRGFYTYDKDGRKTSNKG